MLKKPANSTSKTILADLGLFYSSAIWGSTFILVKISLDAIDPVTMVAYRFLLAAAIMHVTVEPAGMVVPCNSTSSAGWRMII